MKDLYILGAGGFGREIAWVINDINKVKPQYNVIGFLDDREEIQGERINGIKVVGKISEFKDLPEYGKIYATIGILDSLIRRNIIESYKDFNRWATIIHPTAVISETATIGTGTIIFPYATVGVDAAIGANSFLNIHCSVGHDCRLGNNVTMLIGAILGGGVIVGENSCIATNAAVLPGKNVGKNVFVGAGSIVNKKVRDNVTVFGVPARIIAYKSDTDN